MWIRELLQAVPEADLKISVQQRIFSEEPASVQMLLHLAYILQVHQFIWSLQKWCAGRPYGNRRSCKTAFCGPCFGAGDTPANNAFSIRHTTRNFPNREGSKIQNGQISSVALMDARSIAATAANKGFLTSAENFTGTYTGQKYFFDKTIYENRILTARA